jgi:hypothetical protein
LHFCPQVVVATRLCLRIMDHKEAHEAQSVDQYRLSHQLLVL